MRKSFTIFFILIVLRFISLGTVLSFGNFQYMANTENNKLSKATFGGGCFWCTEAIFTRIQGVETVYPGYAGGHSVDPTYGQVTAGTTGHAEVVQITFDPDLVSYIQLLEVFFKTHDPTTLNRQGNDVGTQYRSIILYHDKEQKDGAEMVKSRLDEAGIWDNPIVTEITPLEHFYVAEEYHHNYFANNPSQGYCQFVILPKVEKFKKLFEDLLTK